MTQPNLTNEQSARLEEARRLTADADQLWAEGKFADTARLYQQAVEIAVEVCGENSIEYAQALRNVANLWYVQQKYDEAETAYLQVAEIIEKNVGLQEDLADVLTWLAESRFKNQKYDEAEEPFQQAIAILEQLGEPARDSLATLYSRLAHFYYFVGRYQQAEPQYLKGLALREQVSGPEDLSLAHCASGLARLYYLAPGFSEDPEPLFQRSLQITRKALGENHRDTAEALYRLADFYRHQKRHDEAAPLYQAAISILDAQPDLDEFETRWMRSGYAEFLRETGSEAQAAELEQRWGEWNAFEDMCRNEVRSREISFGPDAPELAESLEHLADSCMFRGDYDEGEEHYLRALSIREKSLGPDHFTLPHVLHGLARVHRVRNEHARAAELLQRAARLTLDHYGSESIEYARTQEHLASLAREQEQHEAAEELYQHAVSTYRKLEGQESREYAEGLYHFAGFYAGTSQFEKAAALLKELTAISEQDIDVAELEKADYYELYANVLRELGRTSEAEILDERVKAIWAKRTSDDDSFAEDD